MGTMLPLLKKHQAGWNGYVLFLFGVLKKNNPADTTIDIGVECTIGDEYYLLCFGCKMVVEDLSADTFSDAAVARS